MTGTDLSLRGQQDNDDILNVVALEWKKLSDRDRAHWDEEARNDKVRCVSCSSKEIPVDKFLFSHSLGRYVREKAAYKGSWAVKKCRAKKHPLAPKRPMSAFLKFSQTRRQMIKEENPAMENTDISRLLGEMWRNASKQERIPYVEQELKERAIYKEKMKHFREKLAREDAACRSSHQSVQNYQQQPQGYERTYQRIGFENFHIDSFEESTKKGFNQQQQAYPLMPYHQSYPSVSGKIDKGLRYSWNSDPLMIYILFFQIFLSLEILSLSFMRPNPSLSHGRHYHRLK